MNKKKVYILMAYSGAGKTEIAKELSKNGYDVLQSYTTRPQREENEYGHIFCGSEEYEQFKKENKIAAYSFFDGYHYFSTKEQIVNTDVYVCDPEGIEDLKATIPDIEFVTIYIKVDKRTRYRRMRERGDGTDKILSRVTSDGMKFAKKRFDYQVINYELDKAVKIIEFIMKTENETKLN